MFNKQITEAEKRVKEEYCSINLHPDPNTGIFVRLLDENDIFKWEFTLTGAKDSPYKGSIFTL